MEEDDEVGEKKSNRSKKSTKQSQQYVDRTDHTVDLLSAPTTTTTNIEVQAISTPTNLDQTATFIPVYIELFLLLMIQQLFSSVSADNLCTT